MSRRGAGQLLAPRWAIGDGLQRLETAELHMVALRSRRLAQRLPAARHDADVGRRRRTDGDPRPAYHGDRHVAGRADEARLLLLWHAPGDDAGLGRHGGRPRGDGAGPEVCGSHRRHHRASAQPWGADDAARPAARHEHGANGHRRSAAAEDEDVRGGGGAGGADTGRQVLLSGMRGGAACRRQRRRDCHRGGRGGSVSNMRRACHRARGHAGDRTADRGRRHRACG
mmetsp:Transcript_4437/g.12799  ORF Transcript_4437/g.12799 Transcript_4437/m.12799 type:complete len:227 (-) Transcript_4437:858-1538(-)